MPTGEKFLRPVQGWLVAFVMTSLFVLMGASGDDVFARHVGMTVASTAVSKDGARALETPVVQQRIRQAGGIAAHSVRTQSPGDHDAVHVLHVLGACLAVLGVAVLARYRQQNWRRLTRARSPLDSHLVLPASWLADLRRRPPPLSPPRSSPVIRT